MFWTYAVYVTGVHLFAGAVSFGASNEPIHLIVAHGLGVFAGFYLTHYVELETPSLIRMVVLCIVLLAGMKWIVYREWTRQRNRLLSYYRWFMSSAVWFEMDSGSLARKWRAGSGWLWIAHAHLRNPWFFYGDRKEKFCIQ